MNILKTITMVISFYLLAILITWGLGNLIKVCFDFNYQWTFINSVGFVAILEVIKMSFNFISNDFDFGVE